jgi:CRISPR-associated protein Cmr1
MQFKKAPESVAFPPRADRTSETVAFQVITPLFGGGVNINTQNPHLKKPDPVTPVRTASIRGQLRFWWRAAWGCQFESAQMHAQEAEIWGRAATTRKVKGQEVATGPGKVSLRLDTASQLAGTEAAIGQGLGRAYGAFPLQAAREAADKNAGQLTRLAGESRLIITFTGLNAEQIKGVMHAVKAWLAFGGLGGRTRRGFGAVHPLGSQNPLAVLNDLKRDLVNRAGVPSLVSAELALKPLATSTALDALDRGLDRLRTFRQGSNVARNLGSQPNRPGRSRWPEPDAIRRITRMTDPMHSTPETRTDAFPRAAFGLPIIFHFKDRGDPTDTTLKPRGLERFASPIIIRPFRNSTGKYDVLALRLGGPGPGSVELGGTRADNVRTSITAAELATDLHKLNTTLKNQPDVLAAFLAFFQQ